MTISLISTVAAILAGLMLGEIVAKFFDGGSKAGKGGKGKK
jgi:hypothetical protein